VHLRFLGDVAKYPLLEGVCVGTSPEVDKSAVDLRPIDRSPDELDSFSVDRREIDR